jgi:hypothetical protein
MTPTNELALVLSDLWEKLRVIEPDVPQAMLVVHPVGHPNQSLGHHAAARWEDLAADKIPEIALNPILFTNPSATLEVLLHEAAHAILHSRGLHGGVKPNSSYHNKRFRDECFRLGLNCTNVLPGGRRDTNRGWAWTDWPASGIPERYQRLLHQLQEWLRWQTPVVDVPRQPFSLIRAECACQRVIYATVRNLRPAPILCTRCGRPFIPKASSRTSHRTTSRRVPVQ